MVPLAVEIKYMVKFKKTGSLFTEPVTMRVNTVNCNGIMGKGVALAFKQRYPEMFKEYQVQCRAKLFSPGHVHLHKVSEEEYIINLATKGNWWEPSQYEWIGEGLTDIRRILEGWNENRLDLDTSIAMPALGCGNGGLEWPVVKEMISECLEDLPNDIVVFEPGKGF